MLNREAGQVAQLDRLFGQAESARNHRLGGDDRRRRREHDQGDQRPVWRHQEKRVLYGLRVGQQQGALPEIIYEQCRPNQHEPAVANRLLAEMPHIRIKRLATRHAEHHRAQRDPCGNLMFDKKLPAIPRVDGGQNPRILGNLHEAQNHQDGEPEHHRGPKKLADERRAMPLNGEKGDENTDGNRHHKFFKRGCGHVQTLNRRHHRHGRRDDGVAIEHRRAEDTQGNHHPACARGDAKAALRQRGKGKNPAFAFIVRAHHQHQILHRDERQHRPEHHRQNSQHRGLVQGNPVRRIERFFHGVKGAGTDVAKYDTDGADSQRTEFFIGGIHGWRRRVQLPRRQCATAR